MDTKIISAVLLVIGVGVGYIIGTNMDNDSHNMSGDDMEEMSEEMDMSEHEMHDHSMLEVDQEQPIPSVKLEVFKDEKDGYNIHLITTNFTFTPETVNEKAVANSGHAHIYVNGDKLARLYGDWFNLSAKDLSEGENLIEVTLNANDHGEWVLNGEHISDSVTVTK